MLSETKDAIAFVIQVHQPALAYEYIVRDLEEELNNAYLALMFMTEAEISECELYYENLYAALGCAFANVIDGDLKALDFLSINGNVMRAAFGKHKISELMRYSEKRGYINPGEVWCALEECASALGCKAWFDNGINYLQQQIGNCESYPDAFGTSENMKTVAAHIEELRGEYADIVKRFKAGELDSHEARKMCEPIIKETNALFGMYENLKAEYDEAYRRAMQDRIQLERFLSAVLDIERKVRASQNAASLYSAIFEKINFVIHSISPEVFEILKGAQ